MRKLLCLILPLLFCSCSDKSLDIKLLDNAHKTFFVNGVSAIDGLDAVVTSLESIGFRGDRIDTVDLRIIGKELYYYAILENHQHLTKDQLNRLSGNLFANLPSSDWLLEQVNAQGCRVVLSWYPSKAIKSVVIQLDSSSFDEDSNEINKRLTEIFPHNRVGNAYGYKEYYTDDNIVCWYTNNFFLSLEQR